MKFKYKEFVIGVIVGGIIFGGMSILADSILNVSENRFKIKVDGVEKPIEGYNINGYSYFKLRDIGEQVGFSVDFKDNTVLIKRYILNEPVNKEDNVNNISIETLPSDGVWTENYNIYTVNEKRYYRWSYCSNTFLRNTYMDGYSIDTDNKSFVVNLYKKMDKSILLKNIEYTMFQDNLMISEDYFNEYILPLDK